MAWFLITDERNKWLHYNTLKKNKANKHSVAECSFEVSCLFSAPKTEDSRKGKGFPRHSSFDELCEVGSRMLYFESKSEPASPTKPSRKCS